MNPSPFASCLAKQAQVKQLFSTCKEAEKKYEKLIELGRTLPPFPEKYKIPENLVKGCQSQMYLHATCINGKCFFQAHSEALISAGLVALLLLVYNDELPEAILSCPPLFLEELQLHKSLSPGRSNGLAGLLLRLKQEALKFLMLNDVVA
jgi:cysteine desulfuration protein SufE